MSVIPPVVSKNPRQARGSRLVGLDELPTAGVVEVDTEAHGTLAVGVAGGVPFAVSNVCRHQLAKLGRGHVDPDGCLVCPWHRARYDPADGRMVDGPKGRLFGLPPYSKLIEGVTNGPLHGLRTFGVELRDGAIHLT